MLAIIGGSGLGQLATLAISQRRAVQTPYGAPSAALTFGHVDGQEAVFLARHGDQHTIPPHRVNYRANIWALRHCGVSGIVSIGAVGSIRADLHPGDLVLPHQIVDYTWGRASTYYDGEIATDLAALAHVDFTEPYDSRLRERLRRAAVASGLAVADGAVYAATQGPRLETAAEIDQLERAGADVVGMTAMPEAALARELAIPYAALNVVANYAAGRSASGDRITLEAIHAVLETAMHGVRSLLGELLRSDAQGDDR